jgi:hypothetical protein
VNGALAVLGLLALSAVASDGGRAYGKPLKGRSPVPLRALLADPERHAGRAVCVQGVIASLGPGGEGGLELKQDDERVQIRFPKPGWTLPAAAVGRRAAVEGIVVVTRPRPDELGAQPAEGAGELRPVVTIEASGLEIHER